MRDGYIGKHKKGNGRTYRHSATAHAKDVR